ncbi:unnamed protein product [Oppiella nova]|uniref:Dynein light chain n=1 Tax=Oppiella nova TaxID=334625 RepID=A0A7R9MLK9_9ACAR|nr:unnamed protein product [Oppiella nova]CAG2179675.1 unnamed protein product [Oppiella nova]
MKVTTDMSEDMKREAENVVLQAMVRYGVEKDIAAYVKKEFDMKYSPNWHCIVGRNFGSFVTHESRHFAYFNFDHLAVLLWRAG